MFSLLMCLLNYNIDTNLKEIGYQVSMIVSAWKLRDFGFHSDAEFIKFLWFNLFRLRSSTVEGVILI